MTVPATEITKIPAMSGNGIGPWLQDIAAGVRAPHCIVEVGPWLGANTAFMAAGTADHTPPAPIHAYDLFKAQGDEVRKAAAQGLDIALGADTRPLVQSLIAPFGGDVRLHKGDILDVTWDGTPIALYVDDAAKTPTNFYHVLQTFAPSFVPGITIVVLMDYGFWRDLKTAAQRRRFRVQQDLVERHAACFEEIRNEVFDGEVMAAFRYVRPLPMAAIRAQARLRRGLARLTRR